MIISISGTAGSGKSSLAKKLAVALSWPRYYMGGLRRQKAATLGLTLAQYNLLGENDPSTDQEVDLYQKELGEKNDNFIIEGRTSWYFIPQSVKIYLFADHETAAERIAKDLAHSSERNEGALSANRKDIIKSLQQRSQSDQIRYQKYYGFDVNNQSHYDFCLDTSSLSRAEVFRKICHFLSQKGLNVPDWSGLTKSP